MTNIDSLHAVIRRALAVGLAIVGLATASAAPAAAPATPRFRTQVVSYASDPPGKVLEAPGGGRVLTPAVLFTPIAGDNPYGPAIVMLDEGPGAHPLEHGQASRFMAEKLAAIGYTVMSLYGGQERGFSMQPFADTQYAVRGALDYLEVMGHERFVLVGQGYGAIVVANYLANQPDTLLDNAGEKRVRAAVLLNPLTELLRYPRLDFEGGYDAVIAKARASVASGRGGYPATLEPGHGSGAAYDPWILPGPYVAPAIGVLDYWGPEAAERNAALLGRLPVPTRIVAGDADATVSIDKLRALRTASTVDLKTIPRGDAHFTGTEDAVTDDVRAWLAAHALGVAPRVATRVLDAKTDDGRILQGVLYTPEGIDARHRPAIVLVSGRSADTIQASTHWMGWRFAQAGYAVLAPGMRISGTVGVETATLGETAADLGHWNDRLAALGYRRIVMGGHSNGGIWLSNYLSLTRDPRVVGTIYFAPTRDEPTYTRLLDGDAVFERKLADARAAVAAGHGGTTIMGLLSAHAFLEFTGPESRAVHTARVREFTLPGLTIVGAKDPLMSPDFVDEFRTAYHGPMTVLRYPDGTHGLRENKTRVATDVADWMGRTFR